MDIISNLHAEASYRGAVALYNGEEQRRQLLMGAEAKTYEGELAARAGEAKQKAGNISGMASLFQGGASLFSKYGGGGPKQSPAPTSSRSFDNTGSIGAGGINWDIV